MKIPYYKFLTAILLLFYFAQTNAMPSPPIPTEKRAPPPPGLPIDQGVVILAIMALFYGVCIIFNRQFYKSG